jgi:hypothetical protein
MSLATRTASHREREQAKKARKRLRLQRAAIHAAMTEAARMKRSRKKGTTNFDDNMFALGFVAKDGYEHAPSEGEPEAAGDVLDKYRPRDMAHECRFHSEGL